MTQDEALEALEAFFGSLGDTASSGDLSAYVAHYMDEGTLLLPRRPPIIGHRAIGEFFEKFQSKLEIVIDTYEQLKIDLLGEFALVRSQGSGHYLIKATGEKLPFIQNYLDVLRYVGGRWLLAYHAASSSNAGPSVWDLEWETDS